ncbi:unnamed protein product [Caenorhabditis brenneri]
MRKPKCIRRISNWCVRFKSEPEKFPILRLPFLAQKNALLMLELEELIPLSFLSKRSKRMIKRALPSPKKAEYKCKVWLKEDSISINSRLGSYTGSSVDHILEVLSYPPIEVVIDGKDDVNHAIEWVKTNQHCVKEILYLPKISFNDYENILDFVHSLIEVDVRIEIDRSVIYSCSKEEVRIEYPSITPMNVFWSLKCRKIRFIDEEYPYAEFFMSTFGYYKIPESLMIEQMIFELMEERPEIRWTYILSYCEKSEEEWQHPIYGKINECYKMYHVGRKFTFFGAHHDGKKLLVVDIEHNAPDAPDSGLVAST